MSTPLGWDLEAFAKFWADIEYKEAMRQKAALYYYGDYGPPIDLDEPEDDEDECDYGFEGCIDHSCRDIENCLGCELLYGEE
jgi:hypothetical protein